MTDTKIGGNRSFAGGVYWWHGRAGLCFFRLLHFGFVFPHLEVVSAVVFFWSVSSCSFLSLACPFLSFPFLSFIFVLFYPFFIPNLFFVGLQFVCVLPFPRLLLSLTVVVSSSFAFLVTFGYFSSQTPSCWFSVCVCVCFAF